MEEMRQHPRRGFDALTVKAVSRPKCSTSCCTTTNSSTATRLSRRTERQARSATIVRLTTIVDIYAALVEKARLSAAVHPRQGVSA